MSLFRISLMMLAMASYETLFPWIFWILNPNLLCTARFSFDFQQLVWLLSLKFNRFFFICFSTPHSFGRWSCCELICYTFFFVSIIITETLLLPTRLKRHQHLYSSLIKFSSGTSADYITKNVLGLIEIDDGISAISKTNDGNLLKLQGLNKWKIKPFLFMMTYC